MVKTIRWKKVYYGYQGFHDGKVLFSIEGGLCVTDLRPMEKETWEHPEHYRINDREDGKRIAKDLLNEVNLAEHHANRDAWKVEQERTTKVIQDAQDFLEKLKQTKI